MNRKRYITALSLMAIAVAIYFSTHNKGDHFTEKTSSHTRSSQRQEDSQTSLSQRESKEREEMAKVEITKMKTLYMSNAAAGFASSKKNLIADLNLSAEETAALDKIYAHRESELANLLTGDAADEVETMRKICALLRNKGLREDLAAILSPEKLATFDANEATRERETIEARAYRDMAEINDVVTLTDTQKQQALAALMRSAPANVEQEADTRAYMTLHYGQMLNDVDSSAIRGVTNMLDAALKYELPAADTTSQPYQQWTQDNKTQRINHSLSALQPILDEKQLTRYREHLEAEPAW